MQVTLKDGSQKDVAAGSTPYDIALSISEGLARGTVAAVYNGVWIDTTTPLKEDGKIQFITTRDPEALEVIRHSTAHTMALAVKRLYPDICLGVGPAIEEGFYYDIDNLPIKAEDLPKIEKEMDAITQSKLPFTRKVVSRAEAEKIFQNDPYKLELIKEIAENETITIYQVGEFTDLCRGPHVPNTGFVKSFKLLRIAGAYWRGNSKNKMLTRIYGTSFAEKKQLTEYLEARRQAEERDHVKLGRELDLFMTDKNIGQGLPLLTPKGSMMKMVLQRFVEDEEMKRGYIYTFTPFMAKSDLYKVSGHWDHYRDGMFLIEEKTQAGAEPELYALRPMTCPFQFSLYNRKIHSYRELPVRYAETSTLFRNEYSGEMHGLTRIRQFTLADGHIVCMPSQLEEEFQATIDLIAFVMKCLGMKNYSYRFSKWDPNNTEKYINNPEAWENTQTIMKSILDKIGLDYTEAVGEAAFYGPKLDIQMKNVWGKEDTVFTVQIDFALPVRFDMKYIDRDGEQKTPMVIHRSSIGCYERTISYLIEQYAGKFPFWFSPEQVRIIAMNDDVQEYAKSIKAELAESKIRGYADLRDESLSKKIRDAQVEYIPLIVIVGNKELAEKTLSVRTLDGKVKQGMKLSDFKAFCEKLTAEKALDIVLE